MGHIPDGTWKAMRPLFAHLDREVAAVVWKDGSFSELANLHPDPSCNVTFSDEDKARLQNNPDVLAVLHSHPSGSPEPSDADSAGQMAMGVPWGIVAIKSTLRASEGQTGLTRAITGISPPECWGDGVAIPPLLGRTYLWNVRDCFSLVRDFYRLQGRDLPDAIRTREPGLYPADYPQHRPFTTWAPLCGFEPLNWRDREPGDTVVMHMPDWGNERRVNWPKEEPNHCAIYCGEGKYLHQLRDTTSDYWTPKTEDVLPTKLKAIAYRLKEKNARSRRTLR